MDITGYEKKFYEEPDEIAAKENLLLEKILILSDLRGKKCLDFGCGTGYWISILENLQAVCYGLDINESAIHECRKKYPFSKFNLMSGETIDFPKNYFDFVLLAWVLQEITENNILLKILGGLHRVLKNNGRIIIIDNEYPDKRILYKKTKFGDLYLNNGQPEKIRFFPGNTVKPIMAKLNFNFIVNYYTGNSFFEVYQK